MCNLFKVSNQREINELKSEFNRKIYLAFLVGTIIALLFGLLFAPKSGKELRNQLKRICKKYKTKVQGDLYVGNINSDVFHLSSCVHLPNSDNRIVYRNRDEAVASGKNPCHSCNP